MSCAPLMDVWRKLFAKLLIGERLWFWYAVTSPGSKPTMGEGVAGVVGIGMIGGGGGGKVIGTKLVGRGDGVLVEIGEVSVGGGVGVAEAAGEGRCVFEAFKKTC